MNSFSLYYTLIASFCLAADHTSVPHWDVLNNELDSLQNIIIKRHPELLPPFLVSIKGWDRNEANAFAIGLALGKQCDKQESIHIKYNSIGQDEETESDLLKLAIVGFLLRRRGSLHSLPADSRQDTG